MGTLLGVKDGPKVGSAVRAGGQTVGHSEVVWCVGAHAFEWCLADMCLDVPVGYREGVSVGHELGSKLGARDGGGVVMGSWVGTGVARIAWLAGQ